MDSSSSSPSDYDNKHDFDYDLLYNRNQLVQAIKDSNWPAVRNILENEPQLIETVDEIGFTPLMYAVMNNAPDDVLENMIETATVENLEYQTSLGRRNILHFLVVHAARVSALRRVLQRTNTKIKTQDKLGRTPLHDCLRDWGTTRSYEDHKEAAIVLITFGASASIKDEDGKTPLDLYDENGCIGYEQTTRNKKKKELRDLLEELSIPSEILARGPEAVKAFKDALENGEITVVNSRLMFLGNEGSGKTSCVKAMLGKEFNENEPSTDGIITTTVFQTVGKDYSKWEEQKDMDATELTKQILEHSIAANVAETLKQPKNLKQTTKKKKVIKTKTSRFDVSQVKKTSPSSPVASTSAAVQSPEADLPPKTPKKNREIPVSQDTRELTDRLMALGKNVIDSIANKSFRPSDITCIWDYAGQMTYYITHRVFLTDGSSYGVVFSLLDDLEEFAKPRDIHKGHFEMTNLQMIIFWIRSIFEHTVLLHRADEKPLINGMIASPPISLIGTHKDLLKGSDAEKQTLIEAKFRRIFKEIEDTPYESHVDRHMYAVANNAKMDEGIERLKTNVGGYMKAMAKTVPINWVDFQTKVQEAGKTTIHMSLNKITEIALECGINKENLIHVLNYLNDLGVILYSPTNEKLKNTVITNIHMLIGIFMKIITVVKPGDVDMVPVMAKFWRKLNEEGILAERLVRYLWAKELSASEDDDDIIFEDFIEIMKAFGLLFEKNASEKDGRLFVVPSRMKTRSGNRLEIKKDEEGTVCIYVTPTEFLPDAVYDVLVVRFVSLSQDRGCCGDPKLLQNTSEIVFDDEHYLRLGRIFIESKQCLKLEISRIKEREEDGADKPICKPHPDICKEVLDVLKQHLDEVYPSKRVVGYTLNILCLVCSTEGKPHFQELEKCLKNKKMICDKTGERIAMSTAQVQSLFVADLSVDDKRKDQYAMKKLKTSDTTEKIGSARALPGFSVLKAIVSSWYDSHQSLPMLKVLFRDKVENEELSKVTDTMELLNTLFARGDLSPQNLGLLCDTISITKHLELQSKIKERLPSFPDVKKGTISGAFTLHRQKLIKFGMVLTPADVKEIDGLYNTPRKNYADVWNMITDLEKRMIISEGNIKEFIDSLEIFNLSLAINTLTT